MALRSWQRIGVLVAPWAFVVAFAALWVGVLVPRAMDGHAVLACLTLFGSALMSFVAAAVTFSRDVLRGRWP